MMMSQPILDSLDWLEKGGLLLRFAGPRLAASDVSRDSEDPLMPVRLREGGRSPAIVDLARHQTAPERQAGRSRSTPQREVRAKPAAGGGAARGVWQDF
jgi:hypothetical protein